MRLLFLILSILLSACTGNVLFEHPQPLNKENQTNKFLELGTIPLIFEGNYHYYSPAKPPPQLTPPDFLIENFQTKENYLWVKCTHITTLKFEKCG